MGYNGASPLQLSIFCLTVVNQSHLRRANAVTAIAARQIHHLAKDKVK